MEVQRLTIKDLMVGDWVEIDNEFTDVVRIYRDEIGTFCMDEFPISKVSPIPITTEILEKNGINRRGNGCEYMSFEKGYNILFIASNKMFHIHNERCFNGHLKYVHELQHALRLCGIDKEIVL